MLAVLTSPRPSSGGTGLCKAREPGIPGTFAGHFDQSQVGEAIEGQPRMVAGQGFLEFGKDGLAGGRRFHVDEIDDDDAAQVTRSWRAMVWAASRLVLKMGVVEIAYADGQAGIDVDGGHHSVWSMIR